MQLHITSSKPLYPDDPSLESALAPSSHSCEDFPNTFRIGAFSTVQEGIVLQHQHSLMPRDPA
jgi:hypothetical protein